MAIQCLECEKLYILFVPLPGDHVETFQTYPISVLFLKSIKNEI